MWTSFTSGVRFLHFHPKHLANNLRRYRWMNCLLMRELNLECVLRLWDAYISEGERFPQFHVYVCVAFLKSLKGSIMGQDFPFVMKKLQVSLQPERRQHRPIARVPFHRCSVVLAAVLTRLSGGRHCRLDCERY
jgi:hypothetical protein